MIQKLFLLRPLGENEFFQVNLSTDWDYQFSFAYFSDRAAYKTNDKTSRIYWYYVRPLSNSCILKPRMRQMNVFLRTMAYF